MNRKRFLIGAAILVAAVAALALVPVVASGYGSFTYGSTYNWTADKVLDPNKGTAVDVDVYGDKVAVLYTAGTGVYFNRSDDKGDTWAWGTAGIQVTSLHPAAAKSCPQVVWAEDGTEVWAACVCAQCGVEWYVSYTQGATWGASTIPLTVNYPPPGYPAGGWSITGLPTSVSLSSGPNPGTRTNVVMCFTALASSGRCEAFTVQFQGAYSSLLFWASPLVNGASSNNARVVWTGDAQGQYWLVYDNSSNIYGQQFNASFAGNDNGWAWGPNYAWDVDQVANACINPDIAVVSSGALLCTFDLYGVDTADYIGGSFFTTGKQHWGTRSVWCGMYNPAKCFPKTVPCSYFGLASRADANANSRIAWDFANSITSAYVYHTTSGRTIADNPYCAAAARDASGEIYMVVSSIDGGGSGAIQLKRTDTSLPTCSGVSFADSTGSTVGDTYYISPNGTFKVTFTGARDQFRVDGSNPPGWPASSYKDGIATIDVKLGPTSIATLNGATSGNLSLAAVADGEYASLSGTMTDTAGNSANTPATGKVCVDRTIPELVINASGSEEIEGWRQGPVSVSGTATDAVPCHAEYLDTSDPLPEKHMWKAFDGALVLGDGVHELRCRAADEAGNVSQEVVHTFKVKSAPPNTEPALSQVPNGAGWNNQSTTVSLNCTDPVLYQTKYRVDGTTTVGHTRKVQGEWTAYSGPLTLGDGRWNVQYYSVDKAGNTEQTKSIPVNIDTLSPSCSIIKPDKDTIKTDFNDGTQLDVVAGAIDENSLVSSRLLLDGEEATSAASGQLSYAWDVSKLKDGEHRIEVVAVDQAGNVGSIGKNLAAGNTAGDWYFAEGNTLPNFDQYFTVTNPGADKAEVRFEFMLEDGSVVPAQVALAPRQRQTYTLTDFVDQGHTGVAARVHSESQAVVVERPMYFCYKEDNPEVAWKGGHVSVGINVPQTDFFFPEGTTRRNKEDGAFEMWLTLQNPSNKVATVDISYMLGTGQNINKQYPVEAHSRRTVEVAADIGLNQDVSVKLHSDVAIVAERPQYFSYHGWCLDGSNYSGSNSPNTKWYFAEGTTRASFREWLTLQNPNSVDTEATITYMNGDSKVTRVKKLLPALTRVTVDVAADVGMDQDISTTVEAPISIVAERPMYFNYEDKWTGGHTALGSNGLSKNFYIAEGSTRAGFDSWYTMLNPQDSVANVTVTYMFTMGDPKTEKYVIQPHQRLTVKVNDAVGNGLDVSAKIASDQQIMVERPVYFDYEQKWPGGSDAPAYPVD